MKDVVLFYGPLGTGKKSIIGGGETGNLRTIFLLKKNNFNVITIQKPYPVKSTIGYMIYAIKMFLKLFSFLKLMMNAKIRTVHISGFYLHLIYHEYLMILMAKIFNKHCIYELRGGGVTEAYEKRSFIYRIFFKAAINNASVVLCQGETYLPFLEKKTHVPIFHYPNFILNDFQLKTNGIERENKEIIELVYFGRITESKNISLILLLAKELREHNESFNLEIIGSGEKSYVENIGKAIVKYNLADNVTITEPVNHETLKKKLEGKHFFVFPSNEKREGHSNALTEAMSAGIVPVCSNAGFNAEIVGLQELIINDFNPVQYADIIRKIWREDRWKYYSDKMAMRIKNNYTEQIAEKIILKAYNFSKE